MALRTFRHNPSLGGFGGESSSSPLGDDDNAAVGAFCQIVKEIADNAVDACRGGQTVHNNNDNDKSNLRSIKSKKNTNNNTTTSFRIRVNFDPVTEDDGTQVMRLTVTDNGCGMQDIQNCVDAFQTTKGHNATKIINHNNNNDNQQRDANTSGRYGIGLTRKSSFVWQKGYPQAQLVSPFFTMLLFLFQFAYYMRNVWFPILGLPSSLPRPCSQIGPSCRVWWIPKPTRCGVSRERASARLRPSNREPRYHCSFR